MLRLDGAVAQLGARQTGSLKVRGSIPLSSTIPRPRREAQRRAAVPGPRLRDGFDSSPSLIRASGLRNVGAISSVEAARRSCLFPFLTLPRAPQYPTDIVLDPRTRNGLSWASTV